MNTQSFPSPTGCGEVIWNGQEFENYGPILSYPMPHCPEGWNDDLTDFHEEISQGHHPIDEASFSAALQRVKSINSATSLLEIGCSSGYFLQYIWGEKENFAYIGADIIDKPLYRLAERLKQEHHTVPLLRFDITSCPLPDKSQDIVVALNVLEHIENDEKAIQQIHRILKPGGAFIFEVPAGPSLYDNYDQELHHYRRYRSSDLENMLTANGFSKCSLTHLGVFMYPPFYIIKKLRRLYNKIFPNRASHITQKKTNATLIKFSGSKIFKALFSFELWMGNYISYPMGIRCCGTFIKN